MALGAHMRPYSYMYRAPHRDGVLQRMTNLRKKNRSIHCATNNWMILIRDGKSIGYRMMNEKITELDQLIFPASQAMRTEVARIMKKTKKDNES